ncbi:hypothetical protein FACS1894211_00830 [Clostridia bacterium]|nr:hypothetical protein FACS1894211_00830 [Clostridia bacterium]
MITTDEIIDKGLKDGREYLYIGGEPYRPGDCFLQNGLEVTVKSIFDQTHFTDDRGRDWHSFMFYDRKCEHCFERNADKRTQDRTPAAIVADNARAERDAFKESMLQNKPYQVYDSYERIHFCEKLCWHLVRCGREPSTPTSGALLKCGEKLFNKMYWHFLDCRNATVDTKNGITDFLKSFLENENQNQAD